MAHQDQRPFSFAESFKQHADFLQALDKATQHQQFKDDLSWPSSIGVSVRGHIITLELENLSMGMKADEMSSSDGELLLKLEPGKAS